MGRDGKGYIKSGKRERSDFRRCGNEMVNCRIPNPSPAMPDDGRNRHVCAEEKIQEIRAIALFSRLGGYCESSFMAGNLKIRESEIENFD